MSYEAELLVRQLSQLGRDLQSEVSILGELEDFAVTSEGEYRRLADEYEDQLAEEFLQLDGSVETRKNGARLKSVPSRLIAADAWLEWSRAKAKLRTQQANLQALHRRVEIGRSMLSREKSLLGLVNSGADT